MPVQRSSCLDPAYQDALSRGSASLSLRAVERRLAAAEQELHLQFARIAQLQAALDLLAATVRRSSPDGERR